MSSSTDTQHRVLSVRSILITHLPEIVLTVLRLKNDADSSGGTLETMTGTTSSGESPPTQTKPSPVDAEASTDNNVAKEV